MYKLINFSKFFLSMVAAAILFSAGFASAVEKPQQGEAVLLNAYRINRTKLETNSFGIPHIKACTYRELPGDWLLTFYPGKKIYQPLEDTRQVMYHYQVVNQQRGYLDIILSSNAGPFRFFTLHFFPAVHIRMLCT